MLPAKTTLPLDSSTIPDRWTLDTRFQGRLAVHSNVGVGATGGAETHTHSSAAHRHQLNNHTHTVSFGEFISSSNRKVGGEANPKGRHAHSSATSGNPTATTYSSNDSFTTGSASSLPPYYAVNFITSDEADLVPPGAIVYATEILNGFTLCDGNNDTPNLLNRFLIGADETYTFGSTGGSTTHTHSINHSHTSGASHQHSGTSGAYTGSNVQHGGDGSVYGVNAHTHTYTTDAATAPINSYSGNSGDNTSSSLPLYTSLLPLKNMTDGGIAIQKGMIVMTTEEDLPLGWVLCDGSNGTPDLTTNKFVMCDDEVATGGSANHAHANVSHTHTSSGHTHSGTTNNTSVSTYQIDASGSLGKAINPHNHSLSAASTTATYANADYPIAATNNTPPYIEVKYMMATNVALGSGGAALLAFL